MTDMISIDNNISACPFCGCRSFYSLADDRKMCRDCRKKFTPHPKIFRLPDEQKEQIAINFWGMIPAEEGAKVLDLNRKTLQRYYRHLRREISALSDQEILSINSERVHSKQQVPAENKTTIEFPILYISIEKQKLRILTDAIADQIFANAVPQEPCAKILYRNGNIDGRFKLDNLYLRKAHNSQIIEPHEEKYTPIRRFWKFAMTTLAHYKVINNNNILYFFKEMEFRFNTKNEDDALNFLINRLGNDSVGSETTKGGTNEA